MQKMTSFHSTQWPTVRKNSFLHKFPKVNNIYLPSLEKESFEKKWRKIKSKKTKYFNPLKSTPFKIGLPSTKATEEILIQ
jgi:hypothetical protein